MRGSRSLVSSCDWLRRIGAGEGLAALSRVNQRIVALRLRQIGITEHTLDADASQIIAEKAKARTTYKGERGYMPMIGHLGSHSMLNKCPCDGIGRSDRRHSSRESASLVRVCRKKSATRPRRG